MWGGSLDTPTLASSGDWAAENLSWVGGRWESWDHMPADAPSPSASSAVRLDFLTKPTFKDKTIKNFKMTVTEHESPGMGLPSEHGSLGSHCGTSPVFSSAGRCLHDRTVPGPGFVFLLRTFHFHPSHSWVLGRIPGG